MELDRKDIKRYILIAKAIDADICDYDNYDIEQAFARNQKRIQEL
jgi:transmembrane sensor